jgi:hypothetical protein
MGKSNPALSQKPKIFKAILMALLILHRQLSQLKFEDVTTVSQNPAWLHWHMRDQLVLSILIFSLTKNVVVHVVKCTTARELWVTFFAVTKLAVENIKEGHHQSKA